MPLRQQHVEGPFSSRKDAPPINTGLAVGIDLESEKALKKQKQAEYRQQLDYENNKLLQHESQSRKQQLQQQQPTRQQLPRENYTNPSNGSLSFHSPIGSQSSYQPTGTQLNGRFTPREIKNNDYNPFNASGVDKNDRRQRQEDYKRELDRQMYEKQANTQKEKDDNKKIAATNSMASANDSRQNNKNDAHRRQEEYQQPLRSQSHSDRNIYYENRLQTDSRHGNEVYHDYENDPQYQEYLRRISKNNQQVLSDNSRNNAYNGEPQRSQGFYRSIN